VITESMYFSSYLQSLTLDRFADLYEQCLRYPDQSELDVFHSDAVVERSHRAAELILKRLHRREKRLRAAGDVSRQRRRDLIRLREVVGVERRALARRLTASSKDRPGPVDATARSRASRRLAAQYPEEFLRLLREEQEAIESDRKCRYRATSDEVRKPIREALRLP
jgi:hypothetical protein